MQRNAWFLSAFVFLLVAVLATLSACGSPSPANTDALLPVTEISECQSFRPPLRGAFDLPGRVEITSPSNCTTGIQTEVPIPVFGTYEGIPEDVDIWVLVYPHNMVYLPLSPNACQGEKVARGDGKWQVPVSLGTKGRSPEWFDIVVVLADQEASQFLSDWVRDGCARNWENDVGIPAATLEQMNITEKSSITVQTLD